MAALCENVSIVALAARYFPCQPSWQLAPRTRSGHQLWLTQSGRAALTDNQQSQYALRERTALLMPPGVVHEGSHDPDHPLHCYVIHFQVRLYGVPAPAAFAAVPSLAQIDPADWQQVVDTAAETCRELSCSKAGSTLLANAATSSLLGFFVRYRRDTRLTTSGARSTAVSLVLDRIVRHYNQELTLDELAQCASLTPTHLCHVFRREIGLTPFQYLRSYRLHRAQQLLSQTDIRVGEIAARTGFDDRFYFSRAFRRATGMSPSEYRQARRESPLF
jgi:AraC-like DNA-binding protein